MKRNKRMPRGPSPRKRAMKYLMEHPYAPHTVVADEVEVSVRTVSMAKKSLIESGQAKASFFSRKGAPVIKSDGEGPATGPAPLHEPMDFEGKNLSTEEKLEMLTVMARDGYLAGNFQQVKGATEAHEKLISKSVESTLGPPDPQTDQEKVDRTAVILDVVGPILAVRAVLKAFWETPERTLFTEEIARQIVTHPTGINPWAKTASVSSFESTLENVELDNTKDEEDHQSKESSPVAQKHEDGPSDSGSSDPLD